MDKKNWIIVILVLLLLGSSAGATDGIEKFGDSLTGILDTLIHRMMNNTKKMDDFAIRIHNLEMATGLRKVEVVYPVYILSPDTFENCVAKDNCE